MSVGRGAKSQLIGDAIERFGGDLEDAVWVQYAALHNPDLGGVIQVFNTDHEFFEESAETLAPQWEWKASSGCAT